MIINSSVETLQLLKMIQFEEVDSFHPKTVVSQLKMKFSFIGAILPIRDCGQR